MPDVKRCTGCGEVKPLGDYHRDRTKPDGRASRCATCTRERDRQYHEENRDKELERHRRYYEENREYMNRRDQRRHRRKNDNTTLTATRNGKPWTPAEDDILTADDGRTLFAKAILLGRTYKSCVVRRHRLARREVAA